MLSRLGFSDFFSIQFDSIDSDLIPARITADHGALFEIAGARASHAVCAGKLLSDPNARPTTGDWVAIAHDERRAVIHHVLERKTFLARRAAGTNPKSQLIAANVDLVFIVVAAN